MSLPPASIRVVARLGPRARLARYLSGQSLAAAAMTLAVLLAITLMLFLAELLNDVADGEVLGSALLTLLLLRLPEAVVMSAPLALVVGLLMSFGGLAEGREFDALRAAGTPVFGVLAGMLLPVALWSGGVLLLAGWVQPWAMQQSAELASRMADDLLVSSIQPGQFRTVAGGRITVHAAQHDAATGRMRELFVRFSNGDAIEVVTARAGRIEREPETGRRLLVLEQGRHIGHPAYALQPYRVVDFAVNRIELPLPAAADARSGLQLLALHELIALEDPNVMLEWQRRLLPSLACVLLALIALPASVSGARGSRWSSTVPALAGYLLYSNGATLLIGQVQAGALDMAWLWMMHGLVVAVVMVVLLRWCRRW
ncbi:MAG: LptF/LptG family permease [Wenzhouxiangellaceae bacterium]|nr:LptF/LptG family permease [Wenzhouxiangellaceae bacterium]